MDKSSNGALFQDLQGDNQIPDVAELESLCMNCEENGTTKLLLIKIPFYKEIIVSSFSCNHCGFNNNGIQSGAAIQDKGITYDLLVTKTEDLNREIIKSDFSSVKIPEVDLEIPAATQPGEVTTIEGVIDRAITGLSDANKQRKDIDIETALKLGQFVSKLADLKDVSKPFHFVIEDASGNSFIQNLQAPKKDPNLTITSFDRTREHEVLLGLMHEENNAENQNEDADAKTSADGNDPVNTREEVLHFPTNCSNCNVPCETKMKMIQIPFFKEVIIMATTCDSCGYRTNEVKSGGGIEPKGRRIELEISHPSDMSRDVLKSETCSISIPEIELEVGQGTLGGRFTTVEGILVNIQEQLSSENPFVQGDSANKNMKEGLEKLFDKFKLIKDGTLAVHFILDDPCGNSYLQNLYAPEDDPKMKIIEYERSFDQNEDLGLNDLKTEGYETTS